HGLPELPDDPLLLARLLGRHEVVVVEVDPPNAQIAQFPDDLDGGRRLTRRLAEGVETHLLGDGPEPEAELVVAGRLVHLRPPGTSESPRHKWEGSLVAEVDENCKAHGRLLTSEKEVGDD